MSGPPKKPPSRRDSRFPRSTFWLILGTLLLTVGVHSGMLIGMMAAGWPAIIVVHVVVLFWLAVAAGLTYAIRRRVQDVYDKPMRTLSDATRRVAQGDFSIAVAPVHQGDKQDYLDFMIQDFNKMVTELSGLETLRTDFVANVSHEIKTPLTVIQNYATLLSQPSLPEAERREYAKAVMATTRRLTDLISNILKLSKLENQQIFPEFEPYDLGEQLCECLLGFEELWEAKGLEIQTDIADQVIVCSDREMMALVWNNLFSNAVKFTEPGGLVALSLKEENGEAVVSVRDTGCGISPEARARIFDKFYQGDASHATQGNGLGLALVKRVADITGCRVSVASEAGKGSVFTVKMRRAAGEASQTDIS